MRNNLFNSIIELNSKHIIYNSLHNKILILNNNFNQIIDLLKNNNQNKIEAINPSLYSKLIQQNFLVQEDFNEISVFKEKFNIYAENQENFRLTINPTMGCTFKCWYCYEEHLAKSRLSAETLDRVKLLLNNIVEKNSQLKQFQLGFFGGEPLIYFQQVCEPLIKEWTKLINLYGINPILSFTTNGYLITDSIIESLKEHATYTHLQITLDGYKDDHDKVRYISEQRGSYDQIVTNIQKLAEADFNITLRINYTPDNLSKCEQILCDFKDLEQSKKQNIKVSFHCVWQESHKMKDRYHEVNSIMQSFSNARFKTGTNESLNSIKGMCYADKQSTAVINYNGDVFKCTARPFITPKREGYLDQTGNIVWDKEKVDQRISARLKNKPCQTCRILPRCFGGCTQIQMEATEDYCIHNFDQNKIDNLIINHVKQYVNLD